MSENKTIVIRISGDSGDGVQLVGEQLTVTAALSGSDVRTQPDFPAEIRAPIGTIGGVSGFQLAISEQKLFTAGESLNVLVALNPAALNKSLSFLEQGGLLIINEDNINAKDFDKAKLDKNILDDLKEHYQLLIIPVISNTLKAVEEFKISNTQAKKSKNFYILGIVLWLFDLNPDNCIKFIQNKFKNNHDVLKANEKALLSGYSFGETLELSRQDFIVNKTQRESGDYRQITGLQACSLAIATISVGKDLPTLVAGYPITPASNILQECAKLQDFGIHLFQAEDEISAICACIGAAFGGGLALTCTSGPGFDLKTEGLGLAVITELPLVVLDVQRAGASTGLPTKTGQSDLNQAIFGRHGEAPIPVICAISPADCFNTIIEAFTIAIKYMTPVIVLLDAYLANAAEPWKIPDINALELPEIKTNRFEKPYTRDEFLSRSWNIPGSENFIHQLGGLEKEGEDGKVSYDAQNHQNMVNLRANKIAGIAKTYKKLIVEGNVDADILIIGWGSTYGSLKSLLTQCEKENFKIALVQLTHLNPLPDDLGAIVNKFNTVIVAELNSGHLCNILRAKYLKDIKLISLCSGLPFSTNFLMNEIKAILTVELTNE